MSNIFDMSERRKKLAADEDVSDAAQSSHLYGGGGGGTSPPMDPVDAKIAAAEARTDTKFATLKGQLDLISAKLDSINEKATDARSEARTTRRTVVGTGLSLAALIMALVGFGGNMFGLGSRVDDIARVEAQKAVKERARLEAPAANSSAEVAGNTLEQ